MLERLCYAKFIVVPNYTYLKMKMSRLRGVITVGSSIKHAFDYNVECVENIETLAFDELLIADMEKLANKGLDAPTKHTDSFEAAEQIKEVPLEPAALEGKALRVSSILDQKIGSGARRLSLRQRRYLCVEPLGHARHSEAGRRALP
jgi:hypothetical protein